MITCVAVWTGDKYSIDYVRRLRSSLARNLHHPHRFVVITDHDAPEFLTIPADPALPGWWQKLALFRPGGLAGRCLYVDLDSVIVRGLDHLVDDYADAPLAMAKNWARSGYGGWQSSVMLFHGGAFPELYLEHGPAHRDRLWGDQEWITERLGDAVTEISPGRVCSYKYHCADGPPAAAEICTFHGKPDPHEVGDAWVRERWR